MLPKLKTHEYSLQRTRNVPKQRLVRSSKIFLAWQALPNDPKYDWLLERCHDLAPLLGVAIDLVISKPLCAFYSSWTGLRADRLSMRMKLCSDWLLPLLVTVLLHENCVGAWKPLFWQVCDKSSEKHDLFNWMVFNEKVLSTEDVCSFDVSEALSGACSRSTIESLSVFLVEKALWKALLPFGLVLTWKMVQNLLHCTEDLGSCQMLCSCFRAALQWLNAKLVDRKQPIVQYCQLASFVETLIVWGPMVPLLSMPIVLAVATNFWLFGTILSDSPKEQSEFSLSRSFWVWSLRGSWAVQVWYAFGTWMQWRKLLIPLGAWVFMPAAVWRTGFRLFWPEHKVGIDKLIWDRLMPKTTEQEMEMGERSAIGRTDRVERSST